MDIGINAIKHIEYFTRANEGAMNSSFYNALLAYIQQLSDVFQSMRASPSLVTTNSSEVLHPLGNPPSEEEPATPPARSLIDEGKADEEAQLITDLQLLVSEKDQDLRDLTEQLHSTQQSLQYAQEEYSQLDADYQQLQFANDVLEESVHKIKGQLLTMKASLSYFSSIPQSKEIYYEVEIQQLAEMLGMERTKKEHYIEKYNQESYFKGRYIDKLMSQLTNSNNRCLRHQADAEHAQQECLEALRKLNAETTAKEQVQQQLATATEELQSLKESYKSVTTQLAEYLGKSENSLQTIIDSIETTHAQQLDKTRDSYELQCKKQQLEYEERLAQVHKSCQASLTAMNQFSLQRITEVKRFYEARVARLTQEYTHDEAAFYQQLKQARQALSTVQQEAEEMKRDRDSSQIQQQSLSEAVSSLQQSLDQTRSEMYTRKSKLPKVLVKQHIEQIRTEFSELHSFITESIRANGESFVQTMKKRHQERVSSLKHSLGAEIKRLEELKAMERQTLLDEIKHIEKTRLAELDQANIKYAKLCEESSTKYLEYETEIKTIVQAADSERIEQLEQLKKLHSHKIQEVQEAHAEEIRTLEYRLNHGFRMQLQELNTQHAKELETLRHTHNEEIKKLNQGWTIEVNKLQKQTATIVAAKDHIIKDTELHLERSREECQTLLEANQNQTAELDKLGEISQELIHQVNEYKAALSAAVEQHTEELSEARQQMREALAEEQRKVEERERQKRANCSILTTLHCSVSAIPKPVFIPERVPSQDPAASMDVNPIVTSLQFDLLEKNRQITELMNELKKSSKEVKHWKDTNRVFPLLPGLGNSKSISRSAQRMSPRKRITSFGVSRSRLSKHT